MVSSHYVLECPVCAWIATDDGLLLDCPRRHERALLQVRYTRNDFTPQDGEPGIYRFRDWLPIRKSVDGTGRTIVHHSRELGKAVGLPNLWVAFNGYWPERNATLKTATFKELEAYCVLGRMPENPPTLVVSSAGNTAAAFATLCSQYELPCVIVIPETGLPRMRFHKPIAPCVRTVVLEGTSYTDAISFADRLADELGGQIEGGTRNVARRAGLGTVLLSAVEEMPRMPDYYVQGVGSGAGAIAVHEAARRLIRAGVADHLPRLMLCQNASVSPLHDLWRADTAGSAPTTDRHGEADTQSFADELTNAHPPYAVAGGVRDSLAAAGGELLRADRAAAVAAGDAFAQLEGIDIEPAAAVALACLRDTVRVGRIPKDATVLLNITGGGRRRLERDLQPSHRPQTFWLNRNQVRTGTFTKALIEHCTPENQTTFA